MVFQWFWQRWTITIECFWGGPTIETNGFSMVFKILRAMVNNGLFYPLWSIFSPLWSIFNLIWTLFEKNTISSPCEWILFGSKWLTLRFEETIANFQWFLRRSSPLNVFGRSDHCHQWFYDGFLMLLPSLSMVFDGSGPLVKRCDGFDGSLWSISGLPDKEKIEPKICWSSCFHCFLGFTDLFRFRVGQAV